MITYQQYEKAVYDWLMAKHNEDRNFAFSTRLKANKGSELDYFIGTEKSGYFGFTLWDIPVSYPGSSADLIDFFFEQKETGFKYFIEFGQTLYPEGKQNESALKLIQRIRNHVSNVGPIISESKSDRKDFNFKIGAKKQYYSTLDELLIDLNKSIEILMPIVDDCIEKEKSFNPHFNADRISALDFIDNQIKLENRIKKYMHFKSDVEDSEIDIFPVHSTSSKTSNFHITPLNQILYGPPGTGKTFSTIDMVVDTLEPNNSFNREEKKAKYDQLINENRAFFTTFHQSMSYEEFIEGIKPHTVNDQIRYEVTNGILKDIVEQCFEDIKALKAMSASGTTVLSLSLIHISEPTRH